MKRLLLYTAIILFATGLYSQGSITFNSPRTTGGSELACQTIQLLPGFSFSSASGKTLTLQVNPSTCDPYAGTTSSISNNQNYTQTKTFTTADASHYLETIEYFDGLGRPIQTVQRGITPNTADLITYQEYDGFGRDDKSWLPAIASGNNGAYMALANYKPKAMTTYNNDSAYSRPIYEASPLNRILEQYGPGKSWYTNKRSVKTISLTNIAGVDTLNCILYSITDNNPLDTTVTITRSKNYDTGQLYVTRVADEDGNTIIEFKDKLGQVVLTRQIIRNGSSKNLHDTYYIYDDFGNQKAVLPPIASDAMKTGTSWSNKGTVSLLRDYAYLYEYDSRNRCVAKRIPGTHWIYYIYDKADRLIFTQDGEQRKKTINGKSEWTFNKYDVFGRLIISGIYKTAQTHLQLSETYKNTVFKEQTGNGGYGYTWDTLKQTELEDANTDVLLVNYYDDYETMLKTNSYYKANLDYKAEPGYGIRHTSAKGLLVGTRVKLINPEGKSVNTIQGQIATAMYYDNRGRLIQTKSNNHLSGGMDSEYIVYNFTGQPIKKKHIHSVTGKNTLTEVYAYTYDHAGRLLKTTHQLTDGTTLKPQVTLAENTYDELGRLKTNKANNQANLNTSYTYNIRSWTSNITNAHFNETLAYTYNGNISQMQWGQAGKTRTYNFTYDNLSRLKSAVYSGDGNFSTAYTYDKHGNMLTLQRYGLIETSSDKQIDNLTMSYKGNQMANVTDAVADISMNTSMDFKDYTKGTGIEYTYNANGAMSKDLNKGISSITYNSLNLPQIINIKNMNAEGRNEYTYSAFGEKLRVVQKWNPNYSTNPLIGSTVNTTALTESQTTDYVGNKIYEGNTLKRILVDGGYYEGGNYYFYITDHLGNNRIVANASASVVQSTQYYPFGTSFADRIETSNQPYKYNGKELDSRNGLNMYDYSARYYESAVGRFTTVDPHAEKYYSISPYVYCANNPMRFIDPTGMVIDSTCIEQWNNERQSILSQLNTLVSNNVDGANDVRIASLQGTLGNMKLAEKSSQLYQLGGIDGNLGGSLMIQIQGQ